MWKNQFLETDFLCFRHHWLNRRLQKGVSVEPEARLSHTDLKRLEVGYS